MPWKGHELSWGEHNILMQKRIKYDMPSHCQTLQFAVPVVGDYYATLWTCEIGSEIARRRGEGHQ